MRLLLLGGNGFVGRATAELAVTQGHHVTALNRGNRPTPDGVTLITADRTTGLDALTGHDYDAVIDTWSAAPAVVHAAAQALSGHAGHYTYVSSRSVYTGAGPTPHTENSPLVDGNPHAGPTDYAADKRGGELAADTFAGPVMHARAGLILGPGEDIGRLPWWLNRLHRGGPTLAPGPAGLRLQYIDARDLAAFILHAATTHLTGPYNLVGPSGHTTMGDLLTTANTITGNHAELRWTDPETILAAGIQPWTDLPIWLPPGSDSDHLHQGDVTKALNAGLTIRPVIDTVTDTWAWLQSLDGNAPQRTDRPVVGLDPALERKVLGLR